MKNTCWMCNQQILQENVTEEHIIINACGGKLKSKSIVCKNCIDHFNDLDSKLAEELNTFSNLFNVKRDRGNPQPIKYGKSGDGKRYHILPGKFGKPVLADIPFEKKEHTDGSVTINFTVRNEKELNKKLKELKRKHPDLDIEQAKKKAKRSKIYFEEPISFDSKMGGEAVFRAVCKALINFYIYNGGSRSDIKHLIPYIKTGASKNPVVYHFYPEYEVYERDKNEVSHVIHIEANESKKLLIGYIEFFNAHSYLVMLNKNYSGEKFQSTYVFDLLTQETIKFKTVKLRVDKLNFADPIMIELDKNNVENKLKRMLNFADKIQNNNKLEDVIENSINKVTKGREGERLTNVDIREISDNIIEELIPWLESLIKRKK